VSAEPTLNPQLTCAICGHPVQLQEARTNEYGQAVHPQCFMDALKQKHQPGSQP
jgi:hypothetical protein